MNQKSNIIKYSEKVKDPRLKIRYARGAGDALACILHSKMLGWLTKLITGKDKPCTKCNKRATALNVLFPVPVWKIFFKSDEEYVKSLKEDLKYAGYDVKDTEDPKTINAIKTDRPTLPIENLNNKSKESLDFLNTENHTLMSTSDNYVGDLLIRVQVFKVK